MRLNCMSDFYSNWSKIKSQQQETNLCEMCTHIQEPKIDCTVIRISIMTDLYMTSILVEEVDADIR